MNTLKVSNFQRSRHKQNSLPNILSIKNASTFSQKDAIIFDNYTNRFDSQTQATSPSHQQIPLSKIQSERVFTSPCETTPARSPLKNVSKSSSKHQSPNLPLKQQFQSDQSSNPYFQFNSKYLLTPLDSPKTCPSRINSKHPQNVTRLTTQNSIQSCFNQFSSSSTNRPEELISSIQVTDSILDKQQSLFQQAKHLSANIQQTLIALNLTNHLKQSQGTNTVENEYPMNPETKILMIKMLEKLEKNILEQGRNCLLESLIQDSVMKLNYVIPSVIRQLSEYDHDISRICEQLYSFILIFLDQIQQRIKDGIKNEFSQKLKNGEIQVSEQKDKIGQLQKELISQKMKNFQDQLIYSANDSRLKEQVRKLNQQLLELQKTYTQLQDHYNTQVDYDEYDDDDEDDNDNHQEDAVAINKEGAITNNNQEVTSANIKNEPTISNNE